MSLILTIRTDSDLFKGGGCDLKHPSGILSVGVNCIEIDMKFGTSFIVKTTMSIVSCS